MTWHHIAWLYIQTKPNKHTYSTCMNTCITLHCITQIHTHTNTHTGHTAALFLSRVNETQQAERSQFRISIVFLEHFLHQLRALGSSHAETQGDSPAQGARREPTPATHWLSMAKPSKWATSMKRHLLHSQSDAACKRAARWRNYRRNASEVELTARCGQNWNLGDPVHANTLDGDTGHMGTLAFGETTRVFR